MPTIIGIYEYRWYTPDSAPAPDDGNVEAVIGTDELALRARSISNHLLVEAAAEVPSVVSRERFLRHWEKYGPTLSRTECRKVKIT